jgi:mRNA interferase MazF
VHRAEVRWYKFDHPDKRRPVVVLTRETALGYLKEVTVAPITSTVRDIPTEFVLTAADGMPSDCAVNLDHIQTVGKGRLGSLVATLDESKMKEIRRALLFALGY